VLVRPCEMSSVKDDVVAVFESDYHAPVVTDLDDLVELPGETLCLRLTNEVASSHIVASPKKRGHVEGGANDSEEPASKKPPSVIFDMQSSRRHLAEWNQRVADAEMLREWEASIKQMRKTMEALQRTFRKNHPVSAQIGENERFEQLASFLEMIDSSLPIVFMNPHDRRGYNVLEISFDLETQRLSFVIDELQQLWLEREKDYLLTRETSAASFTLEHRIDSFGTSYGETVVRPSLLDSDDVELLVMMDFGIEESATATPNAHGAETSQATYDLLILTKR
jgi:hypothetical protein